MVNIFPQTCVPIVLAVEMKMWVIREDFAFQSHILKTPVEHHKKAGGLFIKRLRSFTQKASGFFIFGGSDFERVHLSKKNKPLSHLGKKSPFSVRNSC